jgi:16S rRNA (adenine(1408)-N(1))-methyltransferase
VTIDVGTGDGRAVLFIAAAEPTTLAIGIDANAASMAEASRRAAGPPRKGGLANALFVVAAAEAPPEELRGLAARVTVLFPWGSLLRGCLGAHASVAEGMAGLVAPDGTL